MCCFYSLKYSRGYGRKSRKEYSQFYSIAYGSALELETQLIISKDLKFGSIENIDRIMILLEEVLKMLNSMTRILEEKLDARR